LNRQGRQEKQDQNQAADKRSVPFTVYCSPPLSRRWTPMNAEILAIDGEDWNMGLFAMLRATES